MKKVCIIMGVFTFAMLFSSCIWGKSITVTEILFMKGEEVLSDLDDKEILNAIMYKESTNEVDSGTPSFISQLIYSNFGVYITGATMDIPTNKQKIKEDLLPSMSPFFVNYAIKPNEAEYTICDFYQSGSSIIIKIEETTL